MRDYCDEGTPVPIPNTVVKLVYGDNTWLATAREDNSTPTSKQQRKLLLFLLHKMQENLFFFNLVGLRGLEPGTDRL